MGWAKSRGVLSVEAPKFQAKNNYFLVTVKIMTSGYRTLECFTATLPTDLQTLGCELHKNASGPAGGAIALPQTT